MIRVQTFYAANDLRNFSYLILDDVSGDSWIIDPYEAAPMIDYIKKNHLSLKGILNTHQHFDHIRGNKDLIETFKIQVRHINQGETVQLSQDHRIDVLDTPGHTADHQVFFLSTGDKKTALFSGDTLFNAGVGNCKNGGNVGDLYVTTNRLKELPKDILLYPGHDYIKRNLEFALKLEPENNQIQRGLDEVSNEDAAGRRPRTLGEELLVNPFFRLDSEELKQNLKKDTISVEDGEQVRRDLFKTIRSLRDNW